MLYRCIPGSVFWRTVTLEKLLAGLFSTFFDVVDVNRESKQDRNGLQAGCE